MEGIQGLDTAAWERWVAYRKAIKKPYKEVSLRAAAIKLANYGERQADVVEQSIANQWQGLFDLKVTKPEPGEKPKRTKQQIDAANADTERKERECTQSWDERTAERNPMTMLRLCDALLARYGILAGPDRTDIPERVEWLKGVAAEWIKRAAPADVIGDPHVRSLVRKLFGEAGVNRLRDRAEGRMAA